uniref:Uncharacterized protein n=1 Tax=Erpetoichthys calabaricus TaxID=27687 RepID=A0A8C4STS3_ERPCA
PPAHEISDHLGGGGELADIAKPQPIDLAWQTRQEKKTPLNFTLVWHCEDT